MDLSQRRVQQQIIEQPSNDTLAGVDPTAIRYGWVPFKKIRLLGWDGVPNPYVQQKMIAGPTGEVINPFWEWLPKGQLISFPTFNIPEQMPSQDVRLPDGRAAVETVIRQRTALECVVLVARVWGRQGFTILQALQGLDQRIAQRLFTVVQPYDYPIGEIQSELAFADERINATSPIRLADDYVIDPCFDSGEREIAFKLRDEMAIGADIAFSLASEEITATEMSMINRAGSSGKGKTGPDPHDLYLCEELGRGLPQIIGEKKNDLAALEAKLDFVVEGEKQRQAQEEITRLRAEIEELKAALPPAVEPLYCTATKTDGGPCRAIVKAPDTICVSHREREMREKENSINAA